jgi:O-antigen/teichoic acid export membrane protein
VRIGPSASAAQGGPAQSALGTAGSAGLGLLASGLLINGYLVVVGRALPPKEYLYFGAFWSIALVAGLGVFLPLEQLLARLSVGGADRHALLRSGLAVGAVLVAVEIAVVLGCSRLLLPALGRHWSVLIALVAVCVVSALQFVVRGLLIGADRLRLYLAVLVADSFLRVAFAVFVARSFDRSTALFCWTLVAAIGIAHAVALVILLDSSGRNGGRVEPASAQPSGAAMLRAASGLLIGSLSAQVVLNAPPVLVAASARLAQQSAAGQFQAAFQLARLPLFAAVPLQTMLLPFMTRLFLADGGARLRSAAIRFTGGVLVIGLAAALAAAAVGPPALRILYGAGYHTAMGDFALLAVGVVGYLGMLVTTQALVAAQSHRSVALCWLIGLAAAGCTVALVPGLIRGAEAGFVAGSIGSWAAGTFLLSRRLRRGSQRAPAATAEPNRDER